MISPCSFYLLIEFFKMSSCVVSKQYAIFFMMQMSTSLSTLREYLTLFILSSHKFISMSTCKLSKSLYIKK